MRGVNKTNGQNREEPRGEGTPRAEGGGVVNTVTHSSATSAASVRNEVKAASGPGGVEVFIYNGRIYSHPRLPRARLDRVVRGAWDAVCAKCGRRIIDKAVWGGGPAAAVLTRLWFYYDGRYYCEDCL